ncbi:MAG: alanine--glyoxylate aminotransferase family protein [Nitrososphaeria archaeon]|nr:alanine--glyoxylate aminotransferase family protein [Nitrososphaeria archaeon]
MRKTLYIPGPSEVEPETLLELAKPVIAHYGPDWHQLYNETCEVAKKIFSTNEYVTLLPLPGSVCLEMSAFNLIEKDGEKFVAITNGFFGDNIVEMLSAHGAKVLKVESEWGKNVDLKKLEEVLDENPETKAVYLVHNETSTGVLNDLKKVAEVVKKRDKILVVDAISSYGGVELDFDRLGIDFAVGYASKCLSGINGICPVAISKRFIEEVGKRKTPVKSHYFNLTTYMRLSEEWASIGHPHPTSMPTPVVRAFYHVAKKALEEGLEIRYRRHADVAKAYRKAIRALGLNILPKEEDASPTVTTFIVPEKVNGKIRSTLYKNFGYMISGGLGKLENITLRIGHMGYTANPEFLIKLVTALETVLKRLEVINRNLNITDELADIWESLRQYII